MNTLAATSQPTKRVPKQQRAKERIDTIFAATEVMLARAGYDDLTMVGIAAQAGITHTSIYHYFSSVEDLLAALLSRILSDFDQEVDAKLARAETPAQLLEAFLEGIELGFSIYRTSPAARGLWAATRYLPTLRRIDDEDTALTSDKFSRRFIALSPHTDRKALRVTTRMAAALAVPAYAAALSLPRGQQQLAMESFLAMIRARFGAILGLESIN